MQKAWPTRDEADAYLAKTLTRYLATTDANDLNSTPSLRRATTTRPPSWATSWPR